MLNFSPSLIDNPLSTASLTTFLLLAVNLPDGEAYRLAAAVICLSSRLREQSCGLA
jgi:hypothetical protein